MNEKQTASKSNQEKEHIHPVTGGQLPELNEKYNPFLQVYPLLYKSLPLRFQTLGWERVESTSLATESKRKPCFLYNSQQRDVGTFLKSALSSCVNLSKVFKCYRVLSNGYTHVDFFLFEVEITGPLSDSYSIGISSVKKGLERKIQFLRKKIQALDSDIVQLMAQKKNEIQRLTNSTDVRDDAALERIENEIGEKKKAKIPHILSLQELEKYIATDTFRMQAKILVYKDENAMLFESNDKFRVYGGYVKNVADENGENAFVFTVESCLNKEYCVVVRERVKSYRRGSRRLEKTSTKYFVVYKALKRVPINPDHLQSRDLPFGSIASSEKIIVPSCPVYWSRLRWLEQIILWGNNFVFFGPIIFYKGEIVVDPSFTSITVRPDIYKPDTSRKLFLTPKFLSMCCEYKSVSNDNFVKYLLCEKRGEFWLPSKSNLFPKEFNESMLYLLLAHQMSMNEFSTISEDVFKFCILPFLPVNDVFWTSPLNPLLQSELLYFPFLWFSTLEKDYAHIFDEQMIKSNRECWEDAFRTIPDFLQRAKDSTGFMEFVMSKARSNTSKVEDPWYPERISSFMPGMETICKCLYDKAYTFLSALRYLINSSVVDRSSDLALIQPEKQGKVLSRMPLEEFDSLVTLGVSFAIAVIRQLQFDNTRMYFGNQEFVSIYNHHKLLSLAMIVLVRCCRCHYRCFDRVVSLTDASKFELFAEDVMQSFSSFYRVIDSTHAFCSFAVRGLFSCMMIDFVPMLRGMLSEAINNTQLDPWEVLMMWLSSKTMKHLLFTQSGESVKYFEDLKEIRVMRDLKELELFPVSSDGLGIRVMVELLMEYRRFLTHISIRDAEFNAFEAYEYVNHCFDWGDNIETGIKILHQIQRWTDSHSGSYSENIQFLCMVESSLSDDDYRKWVVKVFGIPEFRVLYKLSYDPNTIECLTYRMDEIAAEAHSILSLCVTSGIICSAEEMQFIITAIQILHDNVNFFDLESFINQYNTLWSSRDTFDEYGDHIPPMIDDKPLGQWLLQYRLVFKNTLLMIIQLFLLFPKLIHDTGGFVYQRHSTDEEEMLQGDLTDLQNHYETIAAYFEGAFDIVRSVEDIYPQAIDVFTHALLYLWNSIPMQSIVNLGSSKTPLYQRKIINSCVSKIVRWIGSVFPIYSRSTAAFSVRTTLTGAKYYYGYYGSSIQTNQSINVTHRMCFEDRVFAFSTKTDGSLVEYKDNDGINVFIVVVPKTGIAEGPWQYTPWLICSNPTPLSFPLWEIYRIVAVQTMEAVIANEMLRGDGFFDAAIRIFKNDAYYNWLFDKEKRFSDELFQKMKERTYIAIKIKLFQFAILHRCCDEELRRDFVEQALFQSDFWNSFQGKCKVLHQLPFCDHDMLSRTLDKRFVLDSSMMVLHSVVSLSLSQGPQRAYRYFSDLIDLNKFYQYLYDGHEKADGEIASFKLNEQMVLELLSSFVKNDMLNEPLESYINGILSSNLAVSSYDTGLFPGGENIMVNILSRRCDMLLESYKKKKSGVKIAGQMNFSSVLMAYLQLIIRLAKLENPAPVLEGEKECNNSHLQREEQLIRVISLATDLFSFLKRIIDDSSDATESEIMDLKSEQRAMLCSNAMVMCLKAYQYRVLSGLLRLGDEFSRSPKLKEYALEAVLLFLNICEAQMKWLGSIYPDDTGSDRIETNIVKSGFFRLVDSIIHSIQGGCSIEDSRFIFYRTIFNRSLEACATCFSICKESALNQIHQSMIVALLSSKKLEGTELVKNIKFYLKDEVAIEPQFGSIGHLCEDMHASLSSIMGEDYVNASEELERLFHEESGNTKSIINNLEGSEFEFDSSFSKSIMANNMEDTGPSRVAYAAPPQLKIFAEQQSKFLFDGIQTTEATFDVPEMEGGAQEFIVERGNIFSLALDSLEGNRIPKIEKASSDNNEGKSMKDDERMEMENGEGIESNVFSFSLDFGGNSQDAQKDDSNENKKANEEKERVKENGGIAEQKNENPSEDSVFFGDLDQFLPPEFEFEFTPPTTSTASPNLDIGFEGSNIMPEGFGEFGMNFENVGNENQEPKKDNEFSFALENFELKNIGGNNEPASSEEVEENMNKKKNGEQE